MRRGIAAAAALAGVAVAACGGGDETPDPAADRSTAPVEVDGDGIPVLDDVWGGTCEDPATGTNYAVGPDQDLTAIGDVPWLDLGPGDRVEIHARPAPYREKILIVGQGTADAPITICGVPDADGNRPVIDGDGATTQPGLVSDYEGTQWRGVITLSAPDGSTWGTKAEHVVIDGLEITGGYPGNAFTDFSGSEVDYPDNVAGIFVERGEWITIRNNVITGNANGLFVASGDAEENVSRHILVDNNEFVGNSVEGRDQEHHSYIEADDVVYQFNHYGDVRPGALGGSLKDRSAGTVIRFNVFDGGLRQIDLVEAGDGYPVLSELPSYREAWVYGNLVDLGTGDGAYAVHYGGDLGEPGYYRKGTLYFFHNTVAYRRDQSEIYDGAVFDVSTADETVQIWNNVLYSTSATPGAEPSLIALERTGGNHIFGTNVLSELMHDWRTSDHEPGTFEGLADQTRVDADPGFTDAAAGDYRPLPGSVLVDTAGEAPVDVPDRFTLCCEFTLAGGVQPRDVVGASPDLGAYEAVE